MCPGLNLRSCPTVEISQLSLFLRQHPHLILTKAWRTACLPQVFLWDSMSTVTVGCGVQHWLTFDRIFFHILCELLLPGRRLFSLDDVLNQDRTSSLNVRNLIWSEVVQVRKVYLRNDLQVTVGRMCYPVKPDTRTLLPSRLSSSTASFNFTRSTFHASTRAFLDSSSWGTIWLLRSTKRGGIFGFSLFESIIPMSLSRVMNKKEEEVCQRQLLGAWGAFMYFEGPELRHSQARGLSISRSR